LIERRYVAAEEIAGCARQQRGQNDQPCPVSEKGKILAQVQTFVHLLNLRVIHLHNAILYNNFLF
jgi:hypothetical protein